MSVFGILGASGHGKVVAEAALSSGWEKVLFFDDAYPKHQNNGPWTVIGSSEHLIRDKDHITAAVIAIGDNRARMEVARKLLNQGVCFTKVIHASAVVSCHAEIEQGSVVLPGAVINPGAVIGQHCIINTNAVIEHDCWLDDAVHIAPGANLAGNVSVGQYSWIGVGACVKECIKVDEDVTVGAGSVVIRNVVRGQTVVGVPAQRVLKRERVCA